MLAVTLGQRKGSPSLASFRKQSRSQAAPTTQHVTGRQMVSQRGRTMPQKALNRIQATAKLTAAA